MVRKFEANLGSEAAIWSHRGYEVRGQVVLTDTREDAERLVEVSYGDDLVEVDADADATYYYRDQADADADSDGSSALAVVRKSEVHR